MARKNVNSIPDNSTTTRTLALPLEEDLFRKLGAIAALRGKDKRVLVREVLEAAVEVAKSTGEIK